MGCLICRRVYKGEEKFGQTWTKIIIFCFKTNDYFMLHESYDLWFVLRGSYDLWFVLRGSYDLCFMLRGSYDLWYMLRQSYDLYDLTLKGLSDLGTLEHIAPVVSCLWHIGHTMVIHSSCLCFIIIVRRNIGQMAYTRGSNWSTDFFCRLIRVYTGLRQYFSEGVQNFVYWHFLKSNMAAATPKYN